MRTSPLACMLFTIACTLALRAGEMGARWDFGDESAESKFERVAVPVFHQGSLHTMGHADGRSAADPLCVARLELGKWITQPGSLTGRVEVLGSWNGKLVAAGILGVPGDSSEEPLLCWDGTNWARFPGAEGRRLSGRVEYLVKDRAGDLLAGGMSLRIGAADPVHFARWTGSKWDGLGRIPRLSAKASLTAVAAGPRGQIYALARDRHPADASQLWHRDSTGGWTLIQGAEQMFHLAVTPDDAVYVSGWFRPPLVEQRMPLAHWDGQRWQGLGAGLSHPGAQGVDPPDIAVEVSSLGLWGKDLVVGGGFRRAGELEANLIARWDGRAWHGFGKGLGGLGMAHADGTKGAVYFEINLPTAFVDGGDSLFALGLFNRAGGVGVRGLARWDGSDWDNPLRSPSMTLDGPIRSLVPAGDRLYATGGFHVAGDTAVEGVAVWRNESWSALMPAPPVAPRGGDRQRLAADGTNLWLGVPTVTPGPGELQDLLHWDGNEWRKYPRPLRLGFQDILARDGAVYLFDRGIQRWDRAGVTQVAPRPGSGSEYGVGSLAFLPDGRLCAMVIGPFGSCDILVNDDDAWHLLDGGLMGAFRLSAPLQEDGWMYLGGCFTGVGRTNPGVRPSQVPFGGYPQVAGIARWRAEMGWQPVGPFHREDFFSQQNAIVALASWRGQIFAGGQFHRIGGIQARNIARWDGERWHSVGEGLPDGLRTLAVLGNHLYAGGHFLGKSGKPTRYFARWRLN